MAGSRWSSNRLLLPALILIAGAALRVWGIGDWSLWEDEETSIYFSFHPHDKFPRTFPTFFLMLSYLYKYTGDYVLAGRCLSMLLGIASLGLTYGLVTRQAGRFVALVATTVVAVSPGHLFWSQSIRYYTLILCVQLAATWLFLEGVSARRPVLVLGSIAVAAFAATCHPSAVLLLPVFVGYALIVYLRRATRPAIPVLVVVALGSALAWFLWDYQLWRILSVRNLYTLSSARDPLHVLVTGAVYFGVPGVCLAIVGAVQEVRRPQQETFWFFLLLGAGVPAMLVGLAALDVLNVTYYYGLISLVGIAVLAGYGVQASRRWSRWAQTSTLLLSALCYVIVLGAYFGSSYGDRPRWREAAAHIRASRQPADGPVNAQVPGVIAFYLGVPPSETMRHELVTKLPERPASAVTGWVVIERRLIPEMLGTTLDGRCTLSAQFPSHMLVRDRTAAVYTCPSQ